VKGKKHTPDQVLARSSPARSRFMPKLRLELHVIAQGGGKFRYVFLEMAGICWVWSRRKCYRLVRQ
jgi:hypothetical protein